MFMGFYEFEDFPLLDDILPSLGLVVYFCFLLCTWVYIDLHVRNRMMMDGCPGSTPDMHIIVQLQSRYTLNSQILIYTEAQTKNPERNSNQFQVLLVAVHVHC